MLSFHRREVLHPGDRNNSRLLTLKDFQQRLLALQVDLNQFNSWPKLTVFRYLANAIKHAEGPAAVELKQLRPAWFIYPAFRNDEMSGLLGTTSLYEPLASEDLFIDVEDLDPLVEAASEFWQELDNALGPPTS